jgi:uncharacterized protein YjbI with pentapeptide repeats
MTSTFLGKWRLAFYNSSAHAVYRQSVQPGDLTVFILAFGSPVREMNIAFILRSDSKICFLLNNGKYLGSSLFHFFFANTLAEAIDFSFPGHDRLNLPASFESEITVGTDRFIFLGGGIDLLAATVGQPIQISQITPSLAAVQAKGNCDGGDFAWVDLTNQTLDKVSLIGSNFSHCNLTNFKFLNCGMRRAVFDHCTAPGADLSGSDLAGASLNQVDLTGVVANPIPELYLKPLQPPAPDNPRTSFAGSKLKQSLIGNDWSMLDLRGTTILDLSSPLSSESNPLWAKHSLLTGLNHNNFSHHLLPYASFDNAVLDSVNLNDCDLTHASFIQASMHGTVLSNATLKNANMTGAQLGSLGHLFTLPGGYEVHLDAGPAVNAALREQFEQHGITPCANAALETMATGRFWQLNDLDNEIIYTVRLEMKTNSTQALTVYQPAVAASLVNAYMPDAILTGANLFGITANNIQFYGSRARLDGAAILEEAKLNGSNLSTVNFTQAQLHGINLSNCHLFNAKFNKANLSPSAFGGVADLSNSNLQGADFTGAQLYSANLTNAAVAINVPTKVIAKQGGVYLFSLPYNGDITTLAEYTTELSAAAASFFSLNPGGDEVALQQYLTALKTNNLTPLKLAFLKKKITLSAEARILTVETDSVWQIVDGTQSYTLWTGPDEQGHTELYAASSLTKTRLAFKRSKLTLRWQASVLIDTPGQQWLLDNDSQNPQNFSTGYVKFIMKLNGNVLDVYGTALRILRLGDQNQEQFFTETCQITILSETNMSGNTVCPNGATLSVNQSRSGKSWDTLWLRAAVPPPPPTCVPTNFHWCPPAKMKKD